MSQQGKLVNLRLNANAGTGDMADALGITRDEYCQVENGEKTLAQVFMDRAVEAWLAKTLDSPYTSMAPHVEAVLRKGIEDGHITSEFDLRKAIDEMEVKVTT